VASVTAGIVLFTRDLRVHDNPALQRACEECERVLPLFVFDSAVLERFGAPNRVRFLLDALRDLDGALRERGGALVVRRGDVVHEVVRFGVTTVYLAEDVSSYARAREGRLRAVGLDVRPCPGATVIPPGEILPSSGGDCFSVFTPYWRRWRTQPRRVPLPAPEAIRLPEGVEPGHLPDLDVGATSPGIRHGGETEGRRRLDAWIEGGLDAYEQRRDDLGADSTSRLSASLRFGCVSPLEVTERALGRPGGEAFARQLCWRDIH
jgi:deoxyribodipyrimidine photo-lyase